VATPFGVVPRVRAQQEVNVVSEALTTQLYLSAPENATATKYSQEFSLAGEDAVELQLTVVHIVAPTVGDTVSYFTASIEIGNDGENWTDAGLTLGQIQDIGSFTLVVTGIAAQRARVKYFLDAAAGNSSAIVSTEVHQAML
jgi:hypothetical protein